jgi:hypothetical protein
VRPMHPIAMDTHGRINSELNRNRAYVNLCNRMRRCLHSLARARRRARTLERRVLSASMRDHRAHDREPSRARASSRNTRYSARFRVHVATRLARVCRSSCQVREMRCSSSSTTLPRSSTIVRDLTPRPLGLANLPVENPGIAQSESQIRHATPARHRPSPIKSGARPPPRGSARRGLLLSRSTGRMPLVHGRDRHRCGRSDGGTCSTGAVQRSGQCPSASPDRAPSRHRELRIATYR